MQFGRFNQFAQKVVQRRQQTKDLFSPGIAKTYSCSIAKINKNLKNFLQGQNVSGKFFTKLHHYFQV